MVYVYTICWYVMVLTTVAKIAKVSTTSPTKLRVVSFSWNPFIMPFLNPPLISHFAVLSPESPTVGIGTSRVSAYWTGLAWWRDAKLLIPNFMKNLISKYSPIPWETETWLDVNYSVVHQGCGPLTSDRIYVNGAVTRHPYPFCWFWGALFGNSYFFC